MGAARSKAARLGSARSKAARSKAAYGALVVLVGGERLAELVVSRRNSRWSLRHGGSEHGRGHYPLMVGLHTGLLVGAVAEVVLARRRFRPALGWPALGLVLGGQALRWWCIASLGRQWNTRVFVVPGLSRVTRGPYRWFPHPNYVAVVVEGAALPLVHSAWATSLAFTALNLPLLYVRLRAENTALRALTEVP